MKYLERWRRMHGVYIVDCNSCIGIDAAYSFYKSQTIPRLSRPDYILFSTQQNSLKLSVRC